MPLVSLDPKLALPPGLTHREAERAAARFASIEIVDQRRARPFELTGSIPASVSMVHRGGRQYRGRATHVWEFNLTSPNRLPEENYYLIGVVARRHAYYAAYPAGDGEQDGNLAGWMAGDWKAYSQRERILARYRERQEQEPASTKRRFELALVGTALGTAFLTVCKVDALYYPGPLEEFLPHAAAAIEAEPGRAEYLALAGFIHERLARFTDAARLYGAAAAAEPASAIYACLHADALLFSGDVSGARQAAAEAAHRGRAPQNRYEFGLHRPSIVDVYRQSLFDIAWPVRKRVEGLKEARGRAEARAEEFRQAIVIDPAKVPAHLRDLVPLARQWGVGDDPARGYLTDHATARDKAALRKALPLKRRGEIQDWLDSLGPEGITSDEAGAFMYLLEAVDELGL